MLVLSRQRDESIMIGDDIEISVVDIRGDKVRLGIKAAKEIPVHRKEFYRELKRQGGSMLRTPETPADVPPAPVEIPSKCSSDTQPV